MAGHQRQAWPLREGPASVGSAQASPVGPCSPPVSPQVNAEGSVDSVFSQVCTYLDTLK